LLVACGPESNGTRLLHRILSTSDEEVVHRSLPNARTWWGSEDFPDSTVFVVCLRDPKIAAQSAVRAGYFDYLRTDEAKIEMALHEQVRARNILGRFPRGRTHYMLYEVLVENPKLMISNLGKKLNLSLSIPEEIYDGDAKYLL